MSQIVDLTGAPLASFTQDADWLQPECYVFQPNAFRGPNGEIHARDVFMVIDPSWLGLPEYAGMTYVIFGVPGYERLEKRLEKPLEKPLENSEAISRTYPFMVAEAEVITEAQQELIYNMSEDERLYILKGGIDPHGRFKYHLQTIHPKPFGLRTETLQPLTADIPVLFDKNLRSDQLPHLPVRRSESRSGTENSAQTPPEPPSDVVAGQLPDPSRNETEHSHTDDAALAQIEGPSA